MKKFTAKVACQGQENKDSKDEETCSKEEKTDEFDLQLEWDAKETEDNLRLNFPILKDKKFTLCYRPKENAEPEPIPDPINTSQKLKQFFELLEIKPAIYLYPKEDPPKEKLNIKALIVSCLLSATILIANITQLKAVISDGATDHFKRAVVAFIALSVLLQILNTLLLITANFVKGTSKRHKTFDLWKNRLLNVSIVVMVFVMIINIVIGAIGIT
ncbi:uncharacterized protein LOC134712887 [Mytilus trossulus]|uniref:uncharacterized protein LOC134712887 n=1 Tax=Mytilus trossulus TaxID=6551 RepID=UPI003007AA66